MEPGDLLKLPEIEAVNMGISLVVPAQKIMEVIEQEELMQAQRKTEEDRFKEETGGTLDSVQPTQATAKRFEIPIPETNEFFDALQQVTRKVDTDSKKK